jgi:acetyltransferase-like isoleucine patch superfamily enzyme
MRDRGKYLMPIWGTRVELNKTAKIILHGNLLLNGNKLPRSRAEMYLRLRKGATLTINGDSSFYYGATVEVHNNAEMSFGELSCNSNSVIIAAKKITMGRGCTLARNVIIMDSDHHRTFDDEGNITNFPREVVIGDNVWFGFKSSVMKGAKIKSGSAIGAGCTVYGRVAEHTLVMSEPSRAFGRINWSLEGFPDR